MTARGRRRQGGQAVVIVVAIIVALTVLGVMVFDAGLAMSDRRNLQAYADASALAGARSYGPGVNKAHWVAMQYLGNSLAFTVPSGACSSVSACPAGTYSVTGYTITLSDSWRVNGIFNYPSVLDVVISHTQPPTDGGPMPVTPNVPPPTNYDNASPVAPNVTYVTAAQAKDAFGHWMPGIYNGFAPSGGTMNGGVYKIINATNLNLGSITNTIHTPSGTSDPTGAVAIVLDSSDTGTLDITSAVLNGLDDLNPPGYTGPRDQMGTHNFVIFGGNGAGAFSGTVAVGPGATTHMSGILYI